MKKAFSKKFIIWYAVLFTATLIPLIYLRYGKIPLVPKSFGDEILGSVSINGQERLELSAEQAGEIAAVLKAYTATPVGYYPEGASDGGGIGIECVISIKLFPKNDDPSNSKARLYYFGTKDGKDYAYLPGTRAMYSLINDEETLYIKVRELEERWGYF